MSHSSLNMFRITLGFLLILLMVLSGNAVAVTERFSILDVATDLESPYFFSTISSENLKRKTCLFGLSGQYAYRPFDMINRSGGFARSGVEHLAFSVLSLKYATTDHTVIGIKMPVVFYANYTDPTAGRGALTQGVTAPGDLQFSFKFSRGVGKSKKKEMTFFSFVTAPTGAAEKYFGDSHPVGGILFGGDYKIFRGVQISANLGLDFRERIILRNIDFSHRVLSNVGFLGSLGKGVFVVAEIKARTSLNGFFTDSSSTPVEAITGISIPITRSRMRISVGAGTCVVCGVIGARTRGFINITRNFSAKSLMFWRPEEILSSTENTED